MLWTDRNDPIGAHLLPEVKKSLREFAKREGKSMSLVISEAVTYWIASTGWNDSSESRLVKKKREQ